MNTAKIKLTFSCWCNKVSSIAKFLLNICTSSIGFWEYCVCKQKQHYSFSLFLSQYVFSQLLRHSKRNNSPWATLLTWETSSNPCIHLSKPMIIYIIQEICGHRIKAKPDFQRYDTRHSCTWDKWFKISNKVMDWCILISNSIWQ